MHILGFPHSRTSILKNVFSYFCTSDLFRLFIRLFSFLVILLSILARLLFSLSSHRCCAYTILKPWAISYCDDRLSFFSSSHTSIQHSFSLTTKVSKRQLQPKLIYFCQIILLSPRQSQVPAIWEYQKAISFPFSHLQPSLTFHFCLGHSTVTWLSERSCSDYLCLFKLLRVKLTCLLL